MAIDPKTGKEEVVDEKKDQLTPEQVEKLLKDNQTLSSQVGEMGKKIGSLESLLTDPEFLKAVAKKDGAPGDAADKGGKKPDFENMNNEDLAGYMVNTILGEVKKLVDPMRAETTKVSLKDQLREAEQQFGDFWDYQDAMVKLSSAYPQLDASSLYLLAVGLEKASGKELKKENPERARGGSNRTRPTQTEISSGPSDIAGSIKEKPKNYGDAAGLVYDRVFGKG
jgi:hypothetical protein